MLGDLVIDYNQRRVTVAGHPVELAATEFELLRLLSLNAGRAVTYGSLLRQVWRVRDDSDTARVRSFMMKAAPQTRQRRRLTSVASATRIARPDQHG